MRNRALFSIPIFKIKERAPRRNQGALSERDSNSLSLVLNSNESLYKDFTLSFQVKKIIKYWNYLWFKHYFDRKL